MKVAGYGSRQIAAFCQEILTEGGGAITGLGRQHRSRTQHQAG
jgi:hypothetical protein